MNKITKNITVKVLAVVQTLALCVLPAGTALAAANVSSVTVGGQTGALTSGTGGNATFSVSALGSGSGNVTWSVTSSLPAGVSASFSPNPTSGNLTQDPQVSTLTLTTTNAAAAGTYPFTVQAAGGTNATGDGTLTIGTPVVTQFTLAYSAGANGTLTGSTTQVVNQGTDGTAVTAVADSGFHFTAWSDASTTNPRTDTNVQGNVTVSASFEADATTTIATSTLTVTKMVVGGSATSSDFTLNLFDGLATSTFSGSSTGTVFNFNGTTTYSVTENATSTYDAAFSTDCFGTINPGENKNCTVTNTATSTATTTPNYVITINTPTITGSTVDLTGTASTTNSIGNAAQYDVQILWGDTNTTDSNTTNFAPSNGDFSGTWGTSTHTFSSPGIYTVIAKLFHGSLSGNDGDATSSVQIEIATSTVATSTLTIVKNVINDNGGTATSSDFTINLFDGSATSTFNGSSTGTIFSFNGTTTYSVTENATSTYTASSSADCSGTLNPGENKVCTLTNDDVPPVELPPTLTLVKHSISGDGTFQFQLTGSTSTSTQLTTVNGYATTTITLNEGTTTISELTQPNWEFTSASCIYDNESVGSSIEHGEVISVDNGDDVTCTFTNTSTLGGIRVVKNVLDSNGGEINDNHQFNVTLNGTSTQAFSEGSDALYFGLTAGNYTIEELADSNYDFVSILPVDVDSEATSTQVAVVNGTTTVVTITNKKHAVVTPPTSGNGGGATGGGNILPGFGRGVGSVLGAATDQGNSSCSQGIGSYMRRGQRNDSAQVARLQTFLNGQNLGVTLPVTGFFGPLTEQAVKLFQEKYAADVLTPWGLSKGTGYAYKTTLRWINHLMCIANPLPPVSL